MSESCVICSGMLVVLQKLHLQHDVLQPQLDGHGQSWPHLPASVGRKGFCSANLGFNCEFFTLAGAGASGAVLARSSVRAALAFASTQTFI